MSGSGRDYNLVLLYSLLFLNVVVWLLIGVALNVIVAKFGFLYFISTVAVRSMW